MSDEDDLDFILGPRGEEVEVPPNHVWMPLHDVLRMITDENEAELDRLLGLDRQLQKRPGEEQPRRRRPDAFEKARKQLAKAK